MKLNFHRQMNFKVANIIWQSVLLDNCRSTKIYEIFSHLHKYVDLVIT